MLPFQTIESIYVIIFVSGLFATIDFAIFVLCKAGICNLMHSYTKGGDIDGV